MKIDDKFVVVYHTMTFADLFICTLYNTETQNFQVIEFSYRVDIIKQINLFKKVFNYNKFIFCGYNNYHFDNVVINYILSRLRYWWREDEQTIYYQDICQGCRYITELILKREDNEEVNNYTYIKIFKSFDLAKMLSTKGNMYSLAELGIILGSKSIIRHPSGNSKEFIKSSDKIDEIIEDSKKCCIIIKDILFNSIDKISIRLPMIRTYDYDILSTNDVGIGKAVLRFMYTNKTGLRWNDIKDIQSKADYIYLRDIILPDIEFKTPMFSAILETMKNVYFQLGKSDWEKTIGFGGTKISLTIGGLHSIQEPEIVIPAENERLISLDVESLYPSMVINHSFYPKHLKLEFLEIYKNLFKERLVAKHNNDDIRNKTLKIILNSTIGLYQNKFSWLYDPNTFYKVRVNGQLLMMMFIEQLVEKYSCRIYNLNTDGVIFLIDKNRYDECKAFIDLFQDQYSISFKEEEYKSLWQYSINDYFTLDVNDNLSKKGLFIDDVSIGKSVNNLIVAKSIINYFVNNIPIKQSIDESNNIQDFISYIKVGNNVNLMFNNQNCSPIVRFYHSKMVNNLVKQEDNKTSVLYECINVIPDLPDEIPEDLDKNYYISRINKIINQLTYKQLSLF